MIQEMEKVIAKREQIAIRYKGKSDAAAGRTTKTKGGVISSGGGSASGGEASLGEISAAALKKKVGAWMGKSEPFWV